MPHRKNRLHLRHSFHNNNNNNNNLSSLSLIFQVNLSQPVFIEAKDDGGGGDNWTTGAISRAKLQSYHHHQQTNIQFFIGRMPFLSTNCAKALNGKISNSMDLLTPSSPGRVPTLSLTINSSWLPWGRVAMSLISPLMPVPQLHNNNR